MQISIRGKQLDVGDALREHIRSRLGETVEKYFGQAIESSVVLSREGPLYRADISVHVGRNILVQGHAGADSPYGAFDGAAERIAKRLRRYKRRLRQHRNAKAERASENLVAQQYILAEEPEPAPDDEAAAVTEPDAPVVVAEMTTEIETLTVSEAVMRMDLADQPALVFRNRSHGEINVIYRRRDGNLGWIDPMSPVPAGAGN
jgi:ribosome hibernation promoting factor